MRDTDDRGEWCTELNSSLDVQEHQRGDEDNTCELKEGGPGKRGKSKKEDVLQYRQKNPSSREAVLFFCPKDPNLDSSSKAV